MSKDYIVVESIPSGDRRLLCQHCGESYELCTPSPLYVFATAVHNFSDFHANCLPEDFSKKEQAQYFVFLFENRLMAWPVNGRQVAHITKMVGSDNWLLVYAHFSRDAIAKAKAIIQSEVRSQA